jgi:hypothetical protein
LGLPFQSFYFLGNNWQVVLDILAEMHADLCLMWLLQVLEPNWRWSAIIYVFNIRFHENPSVMSQVASCLQTDGQKSCKPNNPFIDNWV